MTQKTRVKSTFPSIEWFRALRDIINSDEAYRRIGTCDAVVGVKGPASEKYFLLTFEACEAPAVKEVSEAEAADGDVWR